MAASLIPNAEEYLDNGFNVLLIGDHGTGKTQSIMELAKARGIKMKYYSCSTLDPFTDLVGVPVPTDELDREGSPTGRQILTMVRPREIDEAEIIFFDEVNRADPKTLNAIFEIVQFKSINGEPLPNLKVCWAAMNPPDEQYNVEDLDPAFVDRFDIYINLVPKISLQYLTERFPRPIALALKSWYQDHKTRTTNAKDQKENYISPRRVEKIGHIWMALKSPTSVKAAFPATGSFDYAKLSQMLENAQAEVDGKPAPNPQPNTMGQVTGSANPAFAPYTRGSIRRQADAVVFYMQQNPADTATGDAIWRVLDTSIVRVVQADPTLSRVLDSLPAVLLETRLWGMNAAKLSQTRKAYVQAHRTGRSHPALYRVLSVGARRKDWPTAP